MLDLLKSNKHSEQTSELNARVPLMLGPIMNWKKVKHSDYKSLRSKVNVNEEVSAVTSAN